MSISFFTPTHVNLINACYPSNAALVASGADCQPLSQELSKLTYYASNKADTSGKLAKLGSELEKRAVIEARKARTGHQRARGQLLVTLAIFQALTNECRRDVSLLTKALLVSVKEALQCLPDDLEVQARAASTFTAYATYTDGQFVGMDSRVTNEYMSCLQIFCLRCTVVGKDSEQVNRMRLIGIAGVTAVVSSDALFASVDQSRRQTQLIIPALLECLQDAGVDMFTDESVGKIDLSSNSPYLSEFQPRPVMERRAASIHIHIDGQKGPELHDVVNASLKVLRTFVGQCLPPQLRVILQNIMKCFDDLGVWGDMRLCRWYADHVTEWSQYQYRYAVPACLVDELVSIQDSPEATRKHKTLIYMVTNILAAPHPLINLATTEIIGQLSQILLRRVAIDPQDELLQPLIECTSALGTHMYYADQIQDLAEELVARIVNVQLNGVPGKAKNTSDPAREAALCSLLACLSGLTEAADKNAARTEGKGYDSDKGKEKERSRELSESTTTTTRASRRNNVSPESWQETLALLCESNYRIRAMYARSLASFVRQEVQTEPFVQKEEGEDPMLAKIRVVVDPSFKASSRPSILVADPVSRFLNALHGSIYSLVTARTDGTQRQSISTLDDSGEDFMTNITIVPPSMSNLPLPIAEDVPCTSPVAPLDPSELSSMSTAASSIRESPRSSNVPMEITNRHKHQHAHRGRKISVAMSLLEPANNPAVPPPTLSDFALLRELLLCAHQQVPTRALLTGVPMLLALDKRIRSTMELGSERTKAARELVCVVWMAVGHIWDVPSIVEISKRALEELQPHLIPQLHYPRLSTLHDREEPIDFPSSLVEVQGPPDLPCIDPEVVLPALASSSALQAITGLDRAGLLRRFTIEWTIELALKESVEQVASQDILRGDASFLKLSPALMHIENLSLASIAHSGPSVGVSDLRQALSGRGAISNPALASRASVSTYDRASSLAYGRHSSLHPLSALQGGLTGVQHPAVSRIKARKGKGQPNEVRDVLNKLGIGKQSGVSLLRAPFPMQRSPSITDGKGKGKEKELPGGDEADTNGNPGSPTRLLDPPY